MPEFDNPSFPQLEAEVALASGLLLPELFQLEFGAQEVALEAPEIFIAAPEMVPAMQLAGNSARELETALEFEPMMELGKALEIAQSNRWVLSSPPWVSFAMAYLLTRLDIVLPATLAARVSPEVELVSTAKALEQVLELTPFADSSCGSKEMKT
uniref:Uncharacterized protein n=1 Tax=Vitis vinifera TaxID=29760 RepID=A5B4J7_VITVI|nr:hypothetical protein VITISV_017065 [Vitis vinifera]